MTKAIPCFKGSLNDMAALCKPKYLGQPVQRYLKMAWSYSKDNFQTMANLKEEKAPPKMERLAQAHGKLEGKLDEFITSLSVDGYLGDTLVKNENASLWAAPLAAFADAFVSFGSSEQEQADRGPASLRDEREGH
ncbi:MAG TPA: hypothetical protein VH988_36300 [Thermoanaerobaculia bacterium]|nr:hypothetical protein [Thermoanaerobaculia bacterium]